ncbi:MAG: hypothetical protein WA058_01360 [Minisyncoccia bacterium]
MSKKGNGYDAAAVVAGAVAKCGCPTEKFSACAKKFGQTDTAFADWVLIKEMATVRRRLNCPDSPKKSRSSTAEVLSGN